MAKGPADSTTAPNSELIGAVHNVISPTPADGQQCPLQVDANGNLLVNVVVGGGAPSSNVNIADVNGNPPSLTNPLPVELSDGTQAFGTVSNPINISGSISATNPSVGTTGSVAPTSATEIGIIVGSNLVGVSATNPIPVSGTISSGSLTNNNAAPGVNNQGVLPAVANAANPSWTEGNQVLESVDLSGNQRVKVNAALPAGTNVIGHIIADTGSTTVVTGNVTVVQPTGTNLHAVIDSGTLTTVSTVTAVTAITNALPAGSNVIGHVIADTGSTTAVTGNVTVVQPTGTSLHAVLDATSTTTVTQATGTNLHTVVDSGTLTAVTAITNALPAGANVIGHVITDSGSITTATLSAETTKVIGVVRTSDGAGNLLTSNSTTPAAHFALDSNITSILGTAPTTVGKLDVKGADGDVFVRQTTGTNLHVVTDTTSTTAVTQATAANLNATVVGTGTFAVQDAAAEASLTTIASDLGTIPLALTFVQAVVSSAGTAISTLDKVFASPVTKNNVILVMAMESGAAIPTWAKSAGTGTVQSLGVIKSSATAPAFSLQAWLVTGTGTLTMTATSGGGASVDMAAYAVEIQGTTPAGVMTTAIPWWDSIQVSQGTAASFAFTPFYTEAIGELPFLFIGVGSAATISAESLGDPITAPSASNATTGGVGNLQLFSAARPVNAAPYLKMGTLAPTITFSGSTLYTAVYISLRPYALSIAGSVTSNLNRVGGNLVTTAASGTQLVGNADGVGNALTSNSTTPTAHFALDSNILSILGTAPTTVGKLDIKGADGDVFVRQATAANLNATIVPGGSAIFEVSPTTAANTNANPFFNSITDGTTKVTVIAATAALKIDLSSVAGTATSVAAAGVQKVGVVGNAGAVLDAVTTAATTPANGLATLVANVTTAPSLTTGQSVAVQGDYVGSQFVKPYRRSQTVAKATTITNSAAATSVLAAQAAGIFADISNLIITVTPIASVVAQTTFTATLSDGTASYIFDMDAGDLGSTTVPGTPPTNVNITFNPPLPATNSAVAWTVALSAATVTVHITVMAVLQKAS